MNTRIVFLLGAGISIPAGMSKTMEITDRVLSGDDIYRGSDTVYYLGKEPSLYPETAYVSRVIKVLKILYGELSDYYEELPNRVVNYEDLYLLAYSLHTAESTISTPHLQPLVDKLYPRILPLLEKRNNEYDRHMRPIDLYRETKNYIIDVVWHLLNRKIENVEYLGALVDACIDEDFSGVDIFTLNHDLVMEHLLRENSIDYVEGFGAPIGKVRYWNASLFHKDGAKTKLYKLHGSINWFRFIDREFDPTSESIVIPSTSDIYHIKDLSGNFQWPVDGRPVILVGTENKIFDYSSGTFLTLISRFREVIEDVEKLVISGYSFGDRGINRLVFDWLLSQQGRQMVVINPSQNLWITQKEAIWSRTIFIGKGIEEVDYAAIKSSLVE